MLAKERNQLKKATGYINLAKKNPKSESAWKYYYNAALAFIKAGAIPEAISAYKIVVTRYSKSEKAQESLLEMARISEKRLSFGEAIKYFNEYAVKYPKDKNAGGAAQKVCDLAVAISPERAIANCKRLAAYDKVAYSGSLETLINSLYAAKQYDQMNKVIVEFLRQPNLTANQNVAATYKRYVAAGKRDLGQIIMRSK